jgi:hypothetical protein
VITKTTEEIYAALMSVPTAATTHEFDELVTLMIEMNAHIDELERAIGNVPERENGDNKVTAERSFPTFKGLKMTTEMTTESDVTGEATPHPMDYYEREVTTNKAGDTAVYESKPRKSFADLRSKMSPEAQERAAARTKDMLEIDSLITQRDALVKALKLIAAKDGYTNLDPEGDNDKDYGRGAAYAYGVCASIAHAALDRTEGQR